MSTPDRLSVLLDEHASLERELADPAVHADQSRARRLSRRYAQLAPLIQSLDEHARLTGDLAAARELAAEDQAFAVEADELAERLEAVTERLTKLLAPRDPNDSADALTRREREVAYLAATQEPSRAIAERLGLSPRTVDNHLARAYAKLGVASRGELAALLTTAQQPSI